MNQTEAEVFVKKMFHDIWEGHNLDQFNQYYHPEVEADLVEKSIDFSEIQLHAETMKKSWINTKVVFKDIISDGDNRIAVRLNMSGMREKEPVAFEMMGIYELKTNQLYKIFSLSNPPMAYPKVE